MRPISVAALALASAALAELPPSAYEAMQAAAPEVLVVECEAVSVTRSGWFGGGPAQVRAQLRVLEARRTPRRARKGEQLEVRYRHVPLDGAAGPRPIPILQEGRRYLAYLDFTADRWMVPAARGASFVHPPPPAPAPPAPGFEFDRRAERSLPSPLRVRAQFLAPRGDPPGAHVGSAQAWAGVVLSGEPGPEATPASVNVYLVPGGAAVELRARSLFHRGPTFPLPRDGAPHWLVLQAVDGVARVTIDGREVLAQRDWLVDPSHGRVRPQGHPESDCVILGVEVPGEDPDVPLPPHLRDALGR